jgi:hypothetical protein
MLAIRTAFATIKRGALGPFSTPPHNNAHGSFVDSTGRPLETRWTRFMAAALLNCKPDVGAAQAFRLDGANSTLQKPWAVADKEMQGHRSRTCSHPWARDSVFDRSTAIPTDTGMATEHCATMESGFGSFTAGNPCAYIPRCRMFTRYVSPIHAWSLGRDEDAS